MLRFWPLWALLLSACSRSPARDDSGNTRALALATIQPYLDQLRKQVRAPSSGQSDDQSVIVTLADGSRTTLAPPTSAFPANRKLNPAELTSLNAYFKAHRAELGAGAGKDYAFDLVNQFHSDTRTYARFRQTLHRKFGNRSYRIPIQGADLIATFDVGKLRWIRSHLVSPPEPKEILARGKVSFAFSDRQVATFVGLLKTNTPAYGAMKNYFEAIARGQGSNLTFGNFLNRRVSEQRAKLEAFWDLLSEFETTRMLINAALADHLTIVPYQNSWALQISSMFTLPAEFDLDFVPGQKGLIAHNLRLLSHEILAVHAFEAPHFPGGQKLEGTDEAKHAVQRMQEVADYFRKSHGWDGYGETDPAAAAAGVNMYTQLTSSGYRENAAWLAGRHQFVVGAGGEHLYHLDDSISVLGHEYAHAIVQFSSGLAYRGESGAINEHFADLQGATIEATQHRSGVYGYTVGADVLTPSVRDDKQKILELIFNTYHYQPEEKASFNLDRVALRHLYAPPLSYATQYDTVAAAQAVYSANCQPSSENDNCGVHTVSGVPNKAASLIISVLGLEETRKMFFRTVVYRLGESSTFAEYAHQLYEECRIDFADPQKCDVVLASFAAVGVSTVAGAAPPIPAVTDNSPIPTLVPTTPELTFCGWVKPIKNDNLQIFDDKFNAVFAVRSMSLETKGDMRLLSGLDCACVTGRITPATDELGEHMNAFQSVTKVKDRGNICGFSPQLGPLRPQGPPPSSVFEQTEHTLCGWVRANSETGDVVLVDNKFNVSLLNTPRPARTDGDFSVLQRLQCACATGTLAHTVSDKGYRFNYLPKLKKGGVVEKPYTACIGIEWN